MPRKKKEEEEMEDDDVEEEEEDQEEPEEEEAEEEVEEKPKKKVVKKEAPVQTYSADEAKKAYQDKIDELQKEVDAIEDARRQQEMVKDFPTWKQNVEKALADLQRAVRALHNNLDALNKYQQALATTTTKK